MNFGVTRDLPNFTVFTSINRYACGLPNSQIVISWNPNLPLGQVRALIPVPRRLSSATQSTFLCFKPALANTHKVTAIWVSVFAPERN